MGRLIRNQNMHRNKLFQGKSFPIYCLCNGKRMLRVLECTVLLVLAAKWFYVDIINLNIQDPIPSPCTNRLMLTTWQDRSTPISSLTGWVHFFLICGNTPCQDFLWHKSRRLNMIKVSLMPSVSKSRRHHLVTIWQSFDYSERALYFLSHYYHGYWTGMIWLKI